MSKGNELDLRIGQRYEILTHGDGWAAQMSGTLVSVKHQANGKTCYVFDSPEASLPFGLTTDQITAIAPADR